MPRGNYIKKIRESKGISATQLAEKIGKNRATVYRYENGFIENVPSIVLEKIATALNTTVMDILGYPLPPEPALSESEKLTNEIMLLFKQLTPEQQQMTIKFIQTLLKMGE